jgi:hypothetical protein
VSARDFEPVAVTRLRTFAKNARTHSRKQIRQIADSIQRYGFTNPVLISDDDEIIAGHGRVEAAGIRSNANQSAETSSRKGSASAVMMPGPIASAALRRINKDAVKLVEREVVYLSDLGRPPFGSPGCSGRSACA